MEAVRAVYGCAAEAKQLVAFDEEIDVLKARELRVAVPAVDQMAAKRPFGKILRADQREQIALCRRLVERIGDDGVIFARDIIENDVEFRCGRGEVDNLFKPKLFFGLSGIVSEDHGGAIGKSEEIHDPAVGREDHVALDAAPYFFGERGDMIARVEKLAADPIFGAEKVAICGRGKHGVAEDLLGPRAVLNVGHNSATVNEHGHRRAMPADLPCVTAAAQQDGRL